METPESQEPSNGPYVVFRKPSGDLDAPYNEADFNGDYMDDDDPFAYDDDDDDSENTNS